MILIDTFELLCEYVEVFGENIPYIFLEAKFDRFSYTEFFCVKVASTSSLLICGPCAAVQSDASRLPLVRTQLCVLIFQLRFECHQVYGATVTLVR